MVLLWNQFFRSLNQFCNSWAPELEVWCQQLFHWLSKRFNRKRLRFIRIQTLQGLFDVGEGLPELPVRRGEELPDSGQDQLSS